MPASPHTTLALRHPPAPSTAEDKTVAVVTLEAADVRPMDRSEILHVRHLADAAS